MIFHPLSWLMKIYGMCRIVLLTISTMTHICQHSIAQHYLTFLLPIFVDTWMNRCVSIHLHMPIANCFYTDTHDQIIMFVSTQIFIFLWNYDRNTSKDVSNNIAIPSDPLCLTTHYFTRNQKKSQFAIFFSNNCNLAFFCVFSEHKAFFF